MQDIEETLSAAEKAFTALKGLKNKLAPTFITLNKQGNNAEEITIFLLYIGGSLGLFLFGIQIMNNGLKKIEEGKFKQVLKRAGLNPLYGFLIGLVATIILQSSSVTTVMVVSLVNAGIFSLQQGLGVIIGANVGTTVTGQLISFNLKEISLPLIGFSFLLLNLTHRKKWIYLGEIGLGFGLLLLGLETMINSLSPLENSPWVHTLLLKAGASPAIGIFMGTVVTTLIQSSSGLIGIVIAMARKGLLSLPTAMAVILGADVGTCFTSLLAAFKTNVVARRAAMGHLLINLLGMLLVIPFFSTFVYIASCTSGYLPRQIANAHTLYNLFAAFIFLPLIGPLASILEFFVPFKKR